MAWFQTDMLAAADPRRLQGDKVIVVQVMEAAVRQLDNGSLKDQPLAEKALPADHPHLKEYRNRLARRNEAIEVQKGK